jgi:hypothetical protein
VTGSVAPEAVWVAAVHTGESDEQPLGAAVLVDADRLLTCAHVVCDGAGPAGRVRPSLWVGFPTSEDPYHRLQVRKVAVAPRWLAGQRTADVAVLRVAGVLPVGVHPAPLRSPKPCAVVSKQWWAFGFPNFDPLGNDADGTIGALLGYGWVRLDSCSRYHVEPGFSCCRAPRLPTMPSLCLQTRGHPSDADRLPSLVGVNVVHARCAARAPR